MLHISKCRRPDEGENKIPEEGVRNNTVCAEEGDSGEDDRCDQGHAADRNGEPELAADVVVVGIGEGVVFRGVYADHGGA